MNVAKNQKCSSSSAWQQTLPQPRSPFAIALTTPFGVHVHHCLSPNASHLRWLHTTLVMFREREWHAHLPAMKRSAVFHVPAVYQLHGLTALKWSKVTSYYRRRARKRQRGDHDYGQRRSCSRDADRAQRSRLISTTTS